MALTVSLPISAPTGLSATLQSGGSLDASTTYYYVVIAFDQASYTPNTVNVFAYHSPISEEGSFTTTSTERSVLINWENSLNATRYQILVSTTSGDYTNSGGYGTAAESVGNITDGEIGYTITSLSTEVWAFHTCQLVNALPGNINKNLGLLKVDFSTAGVITNLDYVYDTIVTAGYGDYVFYDGFNFMLKGWFTASGTETGSFYFYRKRFIFIKGGVANLSTNYSFQFGYWTSDIAGAYYYQGCSIDILNSRMAFYSYMGSLLKVYGSLVTRGQAFYQKYPENKTITNLVGNSWYIPYHVAEMKDSILDAPLRGNVGYTKDIKLSQTNNFGSSPYIRCKMYTANNLPYIKGGKFYACVFTSPSPLTFYNGAINWSQGGYYTDFYDCEFPAYTDGMIQYPHFAYGSIVYPTTLTSNQEVYVDYSLTATVLDEEGNPLSGVTVSAIDSSGNAVNFIEYDDTIDKEVTGNVFSGSVITDLDGKIGYYIRSYKIELNPANIQYPTSFDIIKTNYYPFTITFSKEGYRDYTVILEELKKKTDMTLTLEYPDNIEIISVF